MNRVFQDFLDSWKESSVRTPLIVRGARQVGKSHTLNHWGRKNFENLLEINFELEPRLAGAFQSLDPERICSDLEVLCGKRIQEGSTLLFLDEIQQCPQALLSLRAFKEKKPGLHVVSAGSLLDFALQSEQSFSFPVGRVTFAHLGPLSFREFLCAIGESALADHLDKVTVRKPPSHPIHQKALELTRAFWRVGGMPEAVHAFVKSKKLADVGQILTRLTQGYAADFSKYKATYDIRKLNLILSALPNLVGRKFKYSAISKDIRARDLKQPLLDLAKAGIHSQVFSTHANGYPLAAEQDLETFKLLALDIGLLLHWMGAKLDVSSPEDFFFVNEGALAEQFVGQELLRLLPFEVTPRLHHWIREKKGSEAEVDYVIELAGKVVPVEVKSGATGRMRSLHQFLLDKGSEFGVRVSEAPLTKNEKILSVPFYLVSQLGRLLP